jgi:hypothetical protein
MKITKTLKELCTPAMLYFIISVITILFALFSGVKLVAIAMKSVFAIFWTFILNLLCKNGYKSVSWFLVLFPYFVMGAVFITTFFKIREGYQGLGLDSDDATNVAAGKMAGEMMKGSTENQKKKKEKEKEAAAAKKKEEADQMKKKPAMDKNN